MKRWEVDLTSHEQWIYLFIYTYISRCLELEDVEEIGQGW